MDLLNQGNEVVLEARAVSLEFKGLAVLSNVSAEVKRGEILAIIGPNGAGKTSLFNCISGFYRPTKGRIFFNGEDITSMPAHKRAALGIGRTFQNLALYNGLSTLENLLAARHIFMRSNFLTGALYFGWARKEEIENRRIVEEVIDLLEIQDIRNDLVGSLPYGMRKRVDLGRALALDPKVLLLDEPMAGMSIEEKEDMARFILDVFEIKQIPIAIVEHDMSLVMDIADRVIVLDFGRKIAEGTPREIAEHPDVIAAYLGLESGHTVKV